MESIGHDSPLYQKIPDGSIRCLACQHKCHIGNGKLGRCRVRGNKNGSLILPTYGRYTIAVDPIEKKPLYHFLPGSRVFSYGTVGCNFCCQFCQNSSLSMWHLDLEDVGNIHESDIGRLEKVTPEEVVAAAIQTGCLSIASTYNEPTVSSEFSYEVFKLAKQRGIYTVYVTNGFESVETLDFLGPYLDSVNIDLKGWSEDFYHRICGGSREGVCKTIQRCVAMGIHTEVTTLVIPTENDSNEELTSIAQFLASVDPEIVWHLSAYHDDYMFEGRGYTPLSTLQRAAKIGTKAGLKYIYLGNVHADEAKITKCPNCSTQLVKRNWSSATISMKNGTCKCGTVVPGLFLDADHRKPKLNKVPPELRDDTENSIGPENSNEDDLPDRFVLYASKRGTSKGIAEQLAAKYSCPAIDIRTVHPFQLSGKFVILVLSTYGRGGPPESAEGFWKEIQSIDDPAALQSTKFAVVGCGSSDFAKTFCGFAKTMESKMIALGATQLIPMTTVDEAEESNNVEEWSNSFKFV